MGRKPATTDEEVANFRRDAEGLTKIHLSGKIAEKLGVDPANFSSYISGSKRPGKDFLKKFYSLAEMKDLEGNTQDTGDNKKIPDYEHGGPSPEVEDAQLKFMDLDLDDPRELKEELFHTLKVTNANYWYGFHELIKSNQSLAGSNNVIARTNETLVKELLAMRGRNDAS